VKVVEAAPVAWLAERPKVTKTAAPKSSAAHEGAAKPRPREDIAREAFPARDGGAPRDGGALRPRR
jgi:hypothetical protein